MPDANKVKKFQETGYSIPVCCGLCVFRNFQSDTANWGTCKKHLYKHLKHTGAPRGISIHRFGRCDDAELDQSAMSHLGPYSWLAEG